MIESLVSSRSKPPTPFFVGAAIFVPETNLESLRKMRFPKQSFDLCLSVEPDIRTPEGCRGDRFRAAQVVFVD